MQNPFCLCMFSFIQVEVNESLILVSDWTFASSAKGFFSSEMASQILNTVVDLGGHLRVIGRVDDLDLLVGASPLAAGCIVTSHNRAVDGGSMWLCCKMGDR